MNKEQKRKLNCNCLVCGRKPKFTATIISEGKSIDVYQCPCGMHQVLVPQVTKSPKRLTV